MGQVVSSQPYIGDHDENIDDEPVDSVLSDQPATVANDEDSETEWNGLIPSKSEPREY